MEKKGKIIIFSLMFSCIKINKGSEKHLKIVLYAVDLR